MSYEEEKREAAMRIFGALSGVDEEYLAACEENCNCNNNYNNNSNTGKRSRSGIAVFVRRYGRAAAAVLVLAVLGVSFLVYQTSDSKDGTANFSGNAADAGGAFSNGSMMQDAVAPKEEMPMELQEPRMKSSMKSETNEEGARTGDVERYALQSVEGAAQEDKMEELTSQLNAHTENAQGEAEKQKEITQPEAAKLAVVGDYLPEVWPTRGSISQISCNDTAGEETLTIRWSYGDNMDDFELSILNMGDTQPVIVADVSKPESYDERLYKVSHGGTVPDEYRQVYADAVFREEEFNKECVAARIVAYVDDTGDTVSFRGRFGVLYQTEDGQFVVVRFNGRGVVDEIWEMMESIDGQ